MSKGTPSPKVRGARRSHPPSSPLVEPVQRRAEASEDPNGLPKSIKKNKKTRNTRKSAVECARRLSV